MLRLSSSRLRHSPLSPRYIFLASPNHIPSRHPKTVVLICYLFQINNLQQQSKRAIMDKWRKETPTMARNRALHEKLLTYALPQHFPAYIATTLERDENGAYLKIPLISPLAAAYKHQACKYCGSFEVGSSHFPCCFPSFTLIHIGTNI